jgi:signal peptidase I
LLEPFKARRPWAAALITFLFDPFVGMLYLSRGLLAALYFLVEIVVSLGAIVLFSSTSVEGLPTLSARLWLPTVAFRVVGTIHAFAIARRKDTAEIPTWYARWYSIIAIVVLSSLIVPLGIRAILYQPFSQRSGSMSPTIDIGDNFFVSKWAYYIREPKRGDVVAFFARNVENAEYVKRIVGLPGDRIQLRNGVLFVNGEAAGLRHTGSSSDQCGDSMCTYQQFVESLPGGRSYRIQRFAHLTDMENTGKYIVPPYHYFMLGDNRDDSLDSRMNLGFVARDDIAGPVVAKFWSSSKHRYVFDRVD